MCQFLKPEETLLRVTRGRQGSPSVSSSTGIVQGTRGLMLASVLLSVISLLVEMVGMRCTTFMAKEPEQKDKVALAGGVIFVIAGQLMKPLNVLPAWNNKRDAWFSRSACFSWNILVRSQDRAGILRPVYSHKRQVGSSPDSQMVHTKALTDTWTFIVISLPQKL